MKSFISNVMGLFCFTAVSCTRSPEPSLSPDVLHGYWVGSYGDLPRSEVISARISIASNGVVQMDAMPLSDQLGKVEHFTGEALLDDLYFYEDNGMQFYLKPRNQAKSHSFNLMFIQKKFVIVYYLDVNTGSKICFEKAARDRAPVAEPPAQKP